MAQGAGRSARLGEHRTAGESPRRGRAGGDGPAGRGPWRRLGVLDPGRRRAALDRAVPGYPAWRPGAGSRHRNTGRERSRLAPPEGGSHSRDPGPARSARDDAAAVGARRASRSPCHRGPCSPPRVADRAPPARLVATPGQALRAAAGHARGEPPRRPRHLPPLQLGRVSKGSRRALPGRRRHEEAERVEEPLERRAGARASLRGATAVARAVERGVRARPWPPGRGPVPRAMARTDRGGALTRRARRPVRLGTCDVHRARG